MVTRQVTARAVVDGVELTASASYDLVDGGSGPGVPSFGTCTHMTFRDSVYGDDDATFNTVLDLGASAYRDLLSVSSYNQASQVQRFGELGIMAHLTVGRWADVVGYDYDKAMTRLREIAPWVIEVAGVNEPDGDGRARSTWLPIVKAHQAELYRRVKGDPATAHIKVGLGALRDKNNNLEADLQAMITACAGSFDFVNLHLYPGGGANVATYVDGRVAMVREVSNAPIVISECGGSTANMSLADQARVSTELVEYGDANGIPVYLYELYDDLDPTGQDLQSNFGDYESNGARKPAATALRALIGKS